MLVWGQFWVTTAWRSSSTLPDNDCLQDAWNSVGCFGDDYYAISDDPDGARGPLMTCRRCVNWFLLIFHWVFDDFHCFSWISMKINGNWWKSMKNCEKQWKPMEINEISLNLVISNGRAWSSRRAPRAQGVASATPDAQALISDCPQWCPATTGVVLVPSKPLNAARTK